jgi:hypothetical protein
MGAHRVVGPESPVPTPHTPDPYLPPTTMEGEVHSYKCITGAASPRTRGHTG